jgi:hypothetical protein
MPKRFNRSALPSPGDAPAAQNTVLRQMQATPEAIREDQATNTLIIPMVMIREGVFQCVNCPTPELYPAGEFGRYPDAWNDRMVTMDHPRMAGRLVSAGTDGVWERFGLGRIRNAHLDGAKLKAEAHIDMVKVSALGSAAIDLIDKIVDGQAIDVSIAAFLDPVPMFGAFEGRNFAAVQTNYVPDHVAILPAGTRGACSFEDGCGVPRVNAGCDCEGACECQGSLEPVSAELGDTNRRELLNAALAKTVTDFFWIVAVFDDHVVYRNDRDQTFSRGFSIDEETGAVTLSDEAIEGTLVSDFMPITVVEEEEDSMDRAAAVNQLIASAASPWHDDDRTFLMEVPDANFAKLAANSAGGEGDQAEARPAAAKPATVAVTPATPPAVDPALGLPAQPAASAAAPPMSAEQYIAAAPAPIRELLSEGVANLHRTRATYVQHLPASEACPFSAAELNEMHTDHLRKLIDFARKATPAAAPAAASSYAAQTPMAASGEPTTGYKPLPAAPAWPT